MKRISPILFLATAAMMFLSDQTSLAQSQSLDMAPGPIAELLPDFDAPAKGGFGNTNSDLLPNRLPTPNRQALPIRSRGDQSLEVNPLPTAASQGFSRTTPRGNSLPLFDTPARPRSAGANINSPPPVMPRTVVLPSSSPGSFYPGSTPVVTDQFDAGSGLVNRAVPLTTNYFEDQSCGCESEMMVSEEDCGCDACSSSEEFFYLDEIGSENYDDCGTAQCAQTEEGFYDTGADCIADHSSRRRGKTGIYSRHRAKHLARKERRARHQQVDLGDYEQEQCLTCEGEEVYAQDLADNVGDYHDVAPAVVPLNSSQVNASTVNTTIGIAGLYFNRSYEDDRQFSASRFANERGLFSNDADEDDFGGYDVNLTRRKANGRGFEARYFALDPSRATATLSGGPFTTLSAASFNDPAIFLSGVGVPNVGLGGGVVADVTAAEVFNNADAHQVTRETSIDNVEFNLLRLGQARQRKRGTGRTVSHEYLVGFRYFKFDESLGYNAQGFRENSIAENLSRAEYLNEVTNSLYGAQIGGRTEIGFLRKFSLIIGTKAGIFSNRFTNDQSVVFSPRGADAVTAQVLTGANRGQVFDTSGSDSEITMLGELDLGLTYQMFSNSRLRVGYRGLFVSDVAFAVPQTELLFSDLNAVENPTDNDELFLHGGYFGLEFAF